MKKKLVSILATSTITLASIGAPFIAYAEDYDQKIENADKKLQALAGKLSAAEEELALVDDEITTAEAESKELEATIQKTQAHLETLQKDIAHLTEVIAKREEKLKEQARAEQTENTFSNYIGIVLNSESIVEAIGRIGAIADLVASGKEMRDQQIADKASVETKKTDVEKSLVEQGERAEKLANVQAALQLKKLDREVYVAAVAAEKSTVEADKEKFVQQKEEAARRAEEARKQKEAEEAARKVAAEEAAKAAQALVLRQQDGSAEKLTVVSTQLAQTEANTDVTAAVAAASGTQQTIANAALAQLGVMQDCTMLVTNALRAAGINYHGWPAGYLSLGSVVSASQAVPGDLVYYANGGMGLAHIGVYIGNGKAVHGGWNGNQTVVSTAYVGSGPVFIRVR